MKRIAAAAATLSLLVLVAPAQAQQEPAMIVELRGSAGQSVGTATLTQSAAGLEVRVQARGLPPGPHGIHFHQVGRCDAPDFMSAGGHFNPDSRQHGLRNPQGAHAGDLPNLVVAADGSANATMASNRATLGRGSNGLIDADGTALVIHADADDDVTDPTGNSGGRIACGVIPIAAGAAPAAQRAPAQLPRTGLGELGPIPLALGMGLAMLGAGAWARRRAE